MEIKKILFLFIIAILISLTLQKKFLEYRLEETSEKIAIPIQSNRTDLGDTYHYYIAGKRFFNYTIFNLFSNPTSTNENPISSISYLSSGALLTSGFISSLSEFFTPTSRDAVLISLIMQGAIAIFIFLYAILVHVKSTGRVGDAISVAIVGCFSVVFLNWFLFVSYYGQYWSEIAVHTPYPEIFRVVNPQAGWGLGLLFVANMKLMLSDYSKKGFYFLIIFSFIMAFFSISTALTLVGAVGLYMATKFLIEKKIYYNVILVLIGLVISLFLYKFQFDYFHNTPIGKELEAGRLVSVNIKFHFFYFLFLLIPVWLLFKNNIKYWLSSLLISSLAIGSICDSVELGSRLWLRGSAIFVWLIISIIVAKVVIFLLEKIESLPIGKKKFSFIVIMATSIISFTLCLPEKISKKSSEGWNGYIEKDKWDILNWLNHNANMRDIVLSSNLEDSVLIPIYTKCKPFINLYASSQDDMALSLKKYIYTLNYYNKTQNYINLINKFNKNTFDAFVKTIADGKTIKLYPYDDYQISAFYSMVLYYPYNKKMALILTEKKEKDELIKILNKLANETVTTLPYYTLVLIDKLHDINNLPTRDGQVLYENSRFLIIKGN